MTSGLLQDKDFEKKNFHSVEWRTRERGEKKRTVDVTSVLHTSTIARWALQCWPRSFDASTKEKEKYWLNWTFACHYSLTQCYVRSWSLSCSSLLCLGQKRTQVSVAKIRHSRGFKGPAGSCRASTAFSASARVSPDFGVDAIWKREKMTRENKVFSSIE